MIVGVAAGARGRMGVDCLVLGQVVTSPEALATVAHKTFLTSVNSNVAQELISPSKATSTIYVLTDIWPLSRMPENVGVQVHGLGEGFIATYIKK